MVSSTFSFNDYHIYLYLVAQSFRLHYCLVLLWTTVHVGLEFGILFVDLNSTWFLCYWWDKSEFLCAFEIGEPI